MTINRDTTIAQMRSRIQDQPATGLAPYTGISDPDLENAIAAALPIFARDIPADLLVEFAGSGNAYYLISSVLPGYLDKVSSIRWVNYPAAVIANNDTISYLDNVEDYEIVEAIAATVRALYLHFITYEPQVTETIRVAYTGQHTLSGLNGAIVTTIPSAFEQAFYDLAAGSALMMLSARYAQTRDGAVNADIVNYGSVSMDLRKLADMYQSRYSEAIGGIIGIPGSPPGTDAWLDWDNNLTGGWDFLFHGRRLR